MSNAEYQMPLAREAKALGRQTGLRWTACKAWMQHAGISGIIDLKDRYPGAEHAECMTKAAEEIETYILTR
ncbi:MAG: hypothetical protein Q8P46_06900 [Hyphomicrobiales bacterium]|nr:hypothetical protein [Hyphomicrobiales bacterium]